MKDTGFMAGDVDSKQEPTSPGLGAERLVSAGQIRQVSFRT